MPIDQSSPASALPIPAGGAPFHQDNDSGERARELATLLDVARAIASTLDLESLLGVIIDQLRRVVEAFGVTILARDGDEVVVIADHGSAIGRHPSLVGLRVPLAPNAALWTLLERGEAVVIDDVHEDSALSRAYRAAVGPLADTALRYVRSWMAVPLARKEQVIGLITLAHGEPMRFTARHGALATAIASQAALAIDHARVFAREQEALRRMTTLAEVSARVAVAGSLETVVAGLLQQLVESSGALAGAVFVTESDLTTAWLAGAHGLPPGYAEAIAEAMRQGHVTFSLDELEEGRPLVRSNVWQTLLAQPRFQHLQRYAAEVAWDTTVLVPLVSRGTKLGLLAAYYHHDRQPDPDELTFLAALGNQAAIAIENARLFTQAQETIVLEERSRLARDLHDSATQTVFSMGMLAEAAQRQHALGSDQLGDTLGRIATLAGQAHAELRALLLELRPEDAVAQGLDAGLARLVSAVHVRSGLDVRITGGITTPLPQPQALAVFRIVQEALNNVVKHARARVVSIDITDGADGSAVRVTDDGMGFAVDAVAAGQGGLGMRSMRERAAAAGLLLHVTSAPGQGTSVVVRRAAALTGDPPFPDRTIGSRSRAGGRGSATSAPSGASRRQRRGPSQTQRKAIRASGPTTPSPAPRP